MEEQEDSEPELKPLKVDYYEGKWKNKECTEWMKKAKKHLEDRFETTTRDWDEYTCDKYDYLDGYIALAIYGLPVKEKTDGENDEPNKEEEDNLIKRYPIYKRVAVAKIRRQMEKVAGTNSKKIQCNEVIVHVRFDDQIDGGKSDLVTVPVYRVLCADLKTTKFVDWEGRIYDSWEKYLENNTLPAGMMCYYDGGFERDANNNDSFEKRAIVFSETSACGFWRTAGRKVNTAVAVVATAAPVLSLGVAAVSYFTPVGWVATAGYLGWAAWGLSWASTVCMGIGVAGAGYNMYDKTLHGVACLSDVLSLASSLAPYLVNYGIAKYIRRTVESGRNLSTIAKVVINGLLIGLSATQISSFLTQLYNFATKPKLTPMDVILFSVSVKNAASTLIGFRFAGTLLAQARVEFQQEELAREAERQRQELERLENERQENELNHQRQVLEGYKNQIQTEEGKAVFDNFVNTETAGRTNSQMIDQNNRIIHVMREMDPNAVFNTFGATNSEIHFSNGETTELMINNNIRLHPRTMTQLMTEQRTVDGHTVLHRYCEATQRLEATVKFFNDNQYLTVEQRNAGISASKDAFINNINGLTKVDRFFTEPQIQKLQSSVNELVNEADRDIFNNLTPAQAFRLNGVIANDIAEDQRRSVVVAAIALHRELHPNNVEDIHRLANTIEIVKLRVRGSNLDGTVDRRPPGDRAQYAQQLADPDSQQFRDLVTVTQGGIDQCDRVAGNQELPLGDGVGPFYHVDKHVVDEYRYFGPEVEGVQYDNLTYEEKVQYYKKHLVADLSNQIARERNGGGFQPQEGERQWTKGTPVYSQDGQHRNTTYSLSLGEERTLNCFTSQPVDYDGSIGPRKMNSVFSSAPRRRR